MSTINFIVAYFKNMPFFNTICVEILPAIIESRITKVGNMKL